MLFETFLQSYLKTPAIPGRLASDAHHLAWWMVQVGGHTVGALTPDQIRAALENLLEAGCSPGAVRHYLRPFRRACTWGMTAGHLPANPCSSNLIPKDQRAAIRALSVEEERALCEALGEPYATWVRFAVLTGLRQAEQFRLRWVDIQFDRAVLTVLSERTGTPAEVSLCPEAIELLRGLRAQTDSRWVFPDPRHPQRPVDTHQFYTREWPKAVQKAGILRCAWKDLRHTCARRLVEAGWTTQALTGFLRHYGKKRVLAYQAWSPERAAATKRVPRTAERPEVNASLKALQEALRERRADQPLTFGELAQFYAVHHLKERPSRAPFDRMYRQYWTAWTDRPCTSITPREVTAWHIGLEHARAHANKALTFLKAIYNWSMRIGILEEIYNPAAHVARYFRPSRERYLTESELVTLLTALPTLPSKYEAYFLTLLYTGARLSEARCMRWKDLEQITTGRGEEPVTLWVKSRTKNGHSHRVPLPKQVVEAIHRLPHDQAYVFPGNPERPLSRPSVDSMWQTVRRRLGLDDVTVHDLRRTVGAHLSQRGENVQTVQNVLAHRGLQQTAIYARLDTRSIGAALQRQADWMSKLGQISKEGPEKCASAAPSPAARSSATIHERKDRTEDSERDGEDEWPGIV